MFAHPVMAVLVALTCWWLATGAVILVARTGDRHARQAMGAMTALALGAVAVVAWTAGSVGVAPVYCAFLAAIAIWAWHEAAFLLGFVTGPRRIAAPGGAQGHARFRAAFSAMRDHELALFATLVVLVVWLWASANPVAALTFALLWVMRLSTKLNIYFGARNAVSDMLPARLSYLQSYFRTDRTNPWFALSVAFAVIVFLACVFAAVAAGEPGMRVAWTLLASFAALGIVEHLFLVLPVRDTTLWAMFVPANPAPVKAHFNNKNGKASVPALTGHN